MSCFLGMDIEYTEERLKITQSRMINRILKEFGIEESRKIKIPMETNFQINEDDLIIDVSYRRLVCCLMYTS